MRCIQELACKHLRKNSFLFDPHKITIVTVTLAVRELDAYNPLFTFVGVEDEFCDMGLRQSTQVLRQVIITKETYVGYYRKIGTFKDFFGEITSFGSGSYPFLRQVGHDLDEGEMKVT